jgi:WD40 repeat protein
VSAAAPAAEPAETVQNPFVGPHPYGRDDRMYGRDGETEDLLDLIVAERVVLLYSPSGAGKTSLVQARLVPRLEADGFHVYPIVSTKLQVSAPLTEGPTPNRYVLSALLSLEERLPASKQRPLDELAELTIARYLAEASHPEGTPENAVLIFDPLEEVLTTSPADRDAKTEFFTQVGAALQDRSIWALFVIREDFVAELDPYARLIPTRFANRYRLDLLEEPAALDAVTLSARDSGVTFQPDAAKKLVDDLRRIRVQHLGTVSEELGPYVEPVQLQVVCRQLWERLGPDVRTIEEADVEGVGDVNQALASYYAKSITATAATTGTDEAVLREWVDRELITAQGFRAQTLYGPHHDPGRDEAVLEDLIDTHLLRSEPRRGAVWYELAHDRLVEPIQKDNEHWRGEHLSDLEQRAALWDDQGRGDDLLVTGPALADAEEALARQGSQPSARMHDFLEMSRRRRQDAERVERARKQSQRLRIIAVAAFVLALLASYLVMVQRDRAEFVRLVTRASTVASFNPDLGLALVLRAAELPGGEVKEIADWIQALLASNTVIRPLRAEGPTPRAVDVSDDGQFMVTGSEAGTLRVWNRNGVLIDGPPLEAGPGVRSVDFGPTGAVVAGSTDHLSVWSSPSDTTPTIIGSSSEVYAVALSHDGGRVASGRKDGTIVVSDTVTRDESPPMRRSDAPNTTAVIDVGWTPDGKVAALDSEGHLVLWDPAAPSAPLRNIPAHSTRGFALDISHNGTKVVTAGDDNAKVWDLANGDLQQNKRQTMWTYGDASDVDFSDDGSRILVTDRDGGLVLYDAQTGTRLAYILQFGSPLVAARLDPEDENRAVLVSEDSAAAIVDISVGHRDRLVALYVTRDGTVVTAADDDTLRLWNSDGQLIRPLDLGLEDDTGIRDIAVSSNGQFVAALDQNKHVTVHALQGNQSLNPVPGEGITAVAISDDGKFVATAAPVDQSGARPEDATYAVTVTNIIGPVDRRVLTPPTPPRTSVTGLAFGPSEQAVAAVYDDSTAVWWNGDGPPMRPQEPVGDSPEDGSPYKLRDASSYKIVWRGDVIATAGRSNVPKTWDAHTGELRHRLSGHTQPVLDIAFDHSGKYLVTAGEDRDVLIWDVSTGKWITRRTFSSPGTDVAFSPDGKRVYLAGRRGTPRVGYLDDRELLDVARNHVSRVISQEECLRYVAPAGRCPGG